MNHNAQDDPDYPPGNIEEDALPGVKTHEPVAVVRFDQQKDDRRDDGDIGQHSGYVVGKSCPGVGSRGDNRPVAARRACGCAVWNLCSAHVAKCHWKPPSKNSFTANNPSSAKSHTVYGISGGLGCKFPIFPSILVVSSSFATEQAYESRSHPPIRRTRSSHL